MGNDTGLDPHLLATLSPEEREAITGADPAEIAALKAVAGDDTAAAAANDGGDDDAGDDSADDAGAGAGGDAPGAGAADDAAAQAAADAAAAAASAPAPAAAAAAAAPTAPAEAAPAPVYQFELPADFNDRVKKAADDEAGIWGRHEQGEISLEEARSELAKLRPVQAELDRMRMQSDISADMRRQAVEQEKRTAVTRLVTHAASDAGGKVDYQNDPEKWADLDTFVRRLAASEANADKPMDWFLQEAHKRVLALHGLTPAKVDDPKPDGGAPGDAAAKAAAAVKQATDKRRQSLDELSPVPNLPAGGAARTDTAGEFSDVMALEGMEFEQAIANMARTNPQRYARFVASGS